jgi:pyruvate/2-oxoglutarate dehydrogenase complex dihydrolipoamide dehydrogenase (E3) component
MVFTEPQVAHVGWLKRDLKASDMAYEVLESKHEDYGAAIAEGAGKMISKCGLAIQNHLRLHRIMFLQHSFPSMSFLSKRTAESRMMNRMKDPLLRKLVRLFV